jgi:DNA mismatch repair protein MutS
MIHEKVNNLAKFIKTSYELYQEVKPLFELEPLTVSFLELWDNLFEKEPHLLSDKGKILRTFFLLNQGKDKLVPLLQMVGFIDSINSISKLYLFHANSYSFPEYLTNQEGPALTSLQVWNPFLDSKKAVKNDFKLGDEVPNNILITGPNASGKSTFIKSVVLGVLMAQTISIVPATSMKITPFELLNTYLNIPDAKGRESLFEAEMYRARNHINAVNNLKVDQYSLVVMDEIFNSTNYEEGVAGAYIIGKELGNIKNSLTIITTHFNYLTKLAKTNNYVNYMFDVEKIDGQIIKSYKIKEGVSKQYLALDLLEKNGYNTEMIQEARQIFQ